MKRAESGAAKAGRKKPRQTLAPRALGKGGIHLRRSQGLVRPEDPIPPADFRGPRQKQKPRSMTSAFAISGQRYT